MALKYSISLLMICLFGRLNAVSQDRSQCGPVMGADRTGVYFPLLTGKSVGVLGNQTSMIGSVHLVDTLINAGIHVSKVFSPEHGFRGNAGAGELVESSIDPKTGVEIVSLYGDKRKPTAESLTSVDIMLFDLQDVGVRFYTYISTLHLVMEACAEAAIPVIVLDRPNPNGFYVDGPLLQPQYTSFVGMHPIPVVHGMTLGEYAMMINGEGWMSGGIKCQLKVVTMENWTHDSLYQPPVSPSPNLPSLSSIYLYPTLCLFEGTPMSIGRGTDHPFTMIGHPDFKIRDIRFIPEPRAFAAPNPKLSGLTCYGIDFTDSIDVVTRNGRLMLEWIIYAFNHYPDTAKFFQPFFDKLSGTDALSLQIRSGWTADQIRASWDLELDAFLQKRRNYLLYIDSDRIRHPLVYE